MTEQLWAPWRLEYIRSADEQPGCVFCLALEAPDDESLVVHRGDRAFVLLNKFPYASGHLMVAPVRHAGDFGGLTTAEAGEIHRLAAQALEALRETMAPDGFNLGWNLGPSRRRGRRRPRPPARRPALERRHELHAGARGREGAARAPGGDAAQARRRLARLALLEPPRLAVVGEQVEERAASNASGPSTPVPSQSPRASSSSATTGLIAVCHTTAWCAVLGHRPLVVGDVVEVDRARVAVLAGAGDARAGAGLAVHAVAERGRVGQRGGDHVARRDLDAADAARAPSSRGRAGAGPSGPR